ncbi:NAD(P)/FAD-dependent oxidoreductase (plasmid) [Agrobacterium vitis]|uniref:flavin-containing monooxygenase n=1 Tax=Agrobacterium vitis TaxID=373 RepID=UPI0012E98088|nr:NAD(P)/FAD-dependent oxidoreductase [Agrobacterium vitis]MVA27570.1 SidA/IucD/PvdA family monooxygenase [Agrobacterium vitis]
MPVENIHTLVIGGGQAGIAMSEHLSRNNVAHLVLEKGRVAESWRSMRWDSLVTNGPAWHDRFPNQTFPGNADAFVPKEGVADYFEAYAKKYNAPIRCGTEVSQVERLDGRPGFHVETSNSVFEARNVVVATGPFQLPNIPPIVAPTADINQMHSSNYRNPDQLGEGAVLVIGAGSSGVQIAEELMRAGCKTYLSVGPHDRPPRSYRGRDCAWWLGVLGKWDAKIQELRSSNHVTVAVSGARGGETIDFRRLAAQGIVLVGMTESFKDGKLSFAQDLGDNLERGDQNYLSLLDEADAFVACNGLNLPEEPEARILGPKAGCIVNPIRELDLTNAGITTIVWATGFRSDYSWLKVNAFDEAGRPKHHRGVSCERGLYFLGLPGLSGRGSSWTPRFTGRSWQDGAVDVFPR